MNLNKMSLLCVLAWRATLFSSQYFGYGSDPRIEYGTAEKQQGLSAVLQRLQHPNQHPLVLRGHYTLTRYTNTGTFNEYTRPLMPLFSFSDLNFNVFSM